MTKKVNKKEAPTVHKFRHLRGWSDVDFKMLHACFDFLCDFVEKEKGQESLDYQVKAMNDLSLSERMNQYRNKNTFNSIRRKARHNANECRYLYNWWTTDYIPKWKANMWDGLSSPQREIEQKMFLRLIRLRRVLWT